MEEHDEHDQHQLHLTIRATNGAVWDIDEFDGETTVAHVVKKAVEHFFDLGAMTAGGEYRLALMIDGEVQSKHLEEHDTLAQAHVHNDAVLALVARAPHVDG